MKTERGLGKGLSALLGTNKVEEKKEKNQTSENMNLDLDILVPNPDQPRKKFNQDKLEELTESISQKGVLQPLIVRPSENGKYQIVAGERRWRASKKAGLKEVPVIIKNLTDKQVLEIALIENIQRDNLSPIEEAKTYQKLIQEFSYTQEELAKEMGVSRAHIANLLRVLTLQDSILQMIEDNKISIGHAKLLVNCDNAYSIALKCYHDEWSVRFLEKSLKVQNSKSVKSLNQTPTKYTSQTLRKAIVDNSFEEKAHEIIIIEKSLQNKLKMKVEINNNDEGGALIIHYKSLEDLDLLIKSLYFVNK